MIPNHILNDLGPDDRVAILSRNGELLFVVHKATVSAAVIRADAAQNGSEVLTTHMRDKATILEYVGERERDVGGEG